MDRYAMDLGTEVSSHEPSGKLGPRERDVLDTLRLLLDCGLDLGIPVGVVFAQRLAAQLVFEDRRGNEVVVVLRPNLAEAFLVALAAGDDEVVPTIEHVTNHE